VGKGYAGAVVEERRLSFSKAINKGMWWYP
jgi:hypothetical protein